VVLDSARWVRRALVPRGLPIQLTVFVTSRCNARCSHCFYADQLNQPAERELGIADYERLAARLPPQLWVAFGGGEPFLRRDLAGIAEAFTRRNRPRHLTLVTNGLDPDRIEAGTREILARRGETEVNVAVSLDGTRELHDRERGVPGNFDRAVETLRRLRRIRDEVAVGFGFTTLTTVHARNAEDLPALERFVEEEVRPDNRGLNLVRGRPLDPSVLDVDLAAYRAAVARKAASLAAGRLPLQGFRFARLHAAKDRVLHREVERVARTGAYRSPCLAGTVGAVVYENGDVAACEILDRRIGNLRDFGGDFRRLWFSPGAEALRREIEERRCRCTWECAVSTNVLFGPRHWPALAREWARGPRAGAADRPAGPSRASTPETASTASSAPSSDRSLTVLVPCRDEAATIERKIRNSLALHFPDPSRSEVIVVDDDSRDGTAAIVERWIRGAGGGAGGGEGANSGRARDAARPTLRFVRNRHASGKAGAIRTGLEEALGEIVLLTDADVAIERDASRRALALFDDPATGVACGEQAFAERLSPDGATPGDGFAPRGGAIQDPPRSLEGIYDRAMRGLRRLESRIDSVFAVHGQMMLFRRSLALEPRAGIAADDVDLALQARRRGFRIRYAAGARFWEARPSTFASEARQKRRRGRAFAQVLWANRDMLFRPQYGVFGLVTLPFQWLFLLGQPVALAASAVTVASGAAALALGTETGPAIAATAAIAGGALLASASRSIRSWVALNGLMLAALVDCVRGARTTDRWPRDRAESRA
jgi:MoaA/NifB/PqqE/SkfB family radical SAM enzyme/glycosyltransferase involved in cell wall biosynthesis